MKFGPILYLPVELSRPCGAGNAASPASSASVALGSASRTQQQTRRRERQQQQKTWDAERSRDEHCRSSVPSNKCMLTSSSFNSRASAAFSAS